ncbi:nucleotidyltransferase domain-containing protein [Aeropyrum camini]|uniref:Predicted nucleotidyltransferase n=1 Tax=Aeropyrum camini SY1 = JCM 12091 TaxID=1198449 RepID=U3TCX5_9CREN|nr:nucleotidyltransferase domain-containing protein [Aeropyrum camini]BAN90276.1 predicted nucleotidyltransferase [Aeropyrum camini SY1 = JCM 12091]
MRVPRERFDEWLSALEKARMAASRIVEHLGDATVILFGSFARGDFNRWSDIDLLVVSPRFRGVRLLDRFDMVSGVVGEGVEIIPMTPEEFREALRKPVWRQALSRSSALVVDRLGLAEEVEAALGRRPQSLEDLEDRVKRLLRTRSS